MGIIAWIIFGLIAGAIAKLIMPGNDGGGFILTCVLGVVGAVVGGWLATMFGFAAASAVSISTVSWSRWSARSLYWAYSGYSDGHNIFTSGSHLRAVFFIRVLIC